MNGRRTGMCRSRAALACSDRVLPIVPACSRVHGLGIKHEHGSPRTAAAALPVFHREDVLWLERVTFGLDSASVAEYRRLGRERFLERQFDRPGHGAAGAGRAPRSRASRCRTPIRCASLAEVNAQLQSHQCHAGRSRQGTGAQSAQRTAATSSPIEAIRRELAARGVLARRNCKEQMVWFWLNHFSVHQNKANLRWLVGDYEERAIRPHALGHFRDLVLATLEHPAMLQYLDNSQNAVGHINENYARELMELHTLGVDAGYTQQDVQQLARVLTGVGVNAGDPPRLRPEWQRLYRAQRRIRIQSGAATISAPRCCSGRTIEGQGFAEVEDAVTLIVEAARLRALHLAAAGDLLRRRQSPAAAGRAHGADFPAHRRRHRRGAAHHVPGTGIQRRARRQIQGSDALRGLRGALRLRRPGDYQHAADGQLAQWPGRSALRPPDARRLSADRAAAGRAPAR